MTPAMNVPDYLQYLHVVMVNTTLPANIGSAARAMHTMGLSQLTVVDPKRPIDDTSHSHAAGGLDVLARAKVVPTLTDALKPCQLVFAASSRSRHLPRPVVTPDQAADIMLQFIDAHLAQHSRPCTLDTDAKSAPPVNIAILFGREDRGLTNEELAFADYHIQIQANPNYPVLNVAAAVQVIASFIYAKFQAHGDHKVAQCVDQGDKIDQTIDHHELEVMLRQVWDEPAITHEQSQLLTERLTELMIQLNLATADHLRALPQRLSRLTSRLQLDQKEYQLLSAVIAKLLKNP